MTLNEVTSILRQFNKWLLGNTGGPQLESHMIRKAIGEAVEMIERLEQIEAAAQNLVKMKGRHNTEIAYQRLVAALEESK